MLDSSALDMLGTMQGKFKRVVLARIPPGHQPGSFDFAPSGTNNFEIPFNSPAPFNSRNFQNSIVVAAHLANIEIEYSSAALIS